MLNDLHLNIDDKHLKIYEIIKSSYNKIQCINNFLIAHNIIKGEKR